MEWQHLTLLFTLLCLTLGLTSGQDNITTGDTTELMNNERYDSTTQVTLAQDSVINSGIHSNTKNKSLHVSNNRNTAKSQKALQGPQNVSTSGQTDLHLQTETETRIATLTRDKSETQSGTEGKRAMDPKARPQSDQPPAGPGGQRERLLGEGVQLVEDFYERYNSTRQVDLVFVLDRSASVPRAGWFSMINFVRDLLEHFTVDADNTRVSVITYSTDVSVEINDLPSHTSSDRENKCTLIQRLENYVKPKVTFGHTATYSALQHAYNVLLNSRPHAKKAVFVLTDGQSNIGKAPVLAAFDIKSLEWDPHWNTSRFGPQVEIYALGIENATLEELQSMASDLPRHVFLIPDFRDFSDLARRLYAHKQEQTWIPAAHAYCSLPCMQMRAHCMCGTRVGEYDCICPRGHQRNNGVCQECPRGAYKTSKSPERCIPCPVNMTTDATGATSRDQCVLHPSFRICTELPEIENGTLFYVRGTRKDEVFNTGVPCSRVSAGNSCHYQCLRGFRLTGVPIMTCNASAKWEGQVPTCQVVQCLPVDHSYGHLKGGSLDYLDNSTVYDSRVQVTCHAGHHATGDTLWRCDEHGRWTRPYGFKCLEMWCNAFMTPANMSTEPKGCQVNKQRLGTKCSVSCPHGFQLEGPSVLSCAFSNYTAAWLPSRPRCKDITPPSIVCPEDQVFYVDSFGGNFATYNYIDHRPMVTDNSGLPYQLAVAGEPLDLRFKVGHNFLEYTATDAEGNSAPCTQRIEVKAREVRLEFCPGDMTFTINSKNGKHRVSWRTPEFHSSQGMKLVTKCASDLNNQELRSGVYNMDCYPDGYPGTEKCTFIVTVREPECLLPEPEPAPAHGALKCAKVRAGGASLFPRTCKIICAEGYEIKLRRTEYLQAMQHINCHWDGNWEVHPQHWPDCGRIRRQNEAKTSGRIVTTFKGHCSNNQESLKQAFEEYLMARICPRDHKCDVVSLEVHCRSRRRRQLRQRRSVDELRSVKSNDTLPLLEDANVTLPGYEKSTDNLDYLVPLTYNNDTWSPNSTMLPVNSSESWNATEDLSDDDSDDEVVFEFELRARTPNDTGLSHDQQVALLLQMNNGLDGIYDSVDYSEGNTIEVKGNNVTINAIDVEAWPEFGINCSEGEVHITEQSLAVSSEIKLCYECPAGTWKSSDTECSPCGFGQYQDLVGQSSCLDCPPGTNTTHEQARSSAQCKAPCASGTYSETSRGNCSLCPQHTYQPLEGQNDCLACPDGTFTAVQGAVNLTQCGVLCEAGTWSSSGLLPCEPCPVNTFQSSEGATQCQPCPGNGYTNDTGAINASLCSGIDFCLTRDNSSICGDHGQCNSTTSGYRCTCNPFFTGSHCETNIDDCEQITCSNGGTCVDGLGTFTCNCPPQYSGLRCEYERNECEPNPCNHGICEDAFGNYTCHCLPGYTGHNCDVRIDLCGSEPCLNQGVCSLTTTGYTCECGPLYTGSHCELYIDRCASSPCVNGGTCQDAGSEFCSCPHQYTGIYCESQVDYCSDNPCQNNGTCWNTPEGAVCKCAIPYAGSLCHLDMEQDFDLVFESGMTSDYVKLLDALPFDIERLTLCVWMRTSDTHNFGTLVSYSRESNWLQADDVNVLTLYDYGRLQVYINGAVRYTGLALNTGRWQHLCVAWNGPTGDLSVYVNGSLQARGVDVATGTHIRAGGIFVIGQKQDTVGNSFISRKSFIGELTQLHIHSRVMTQEEVQAEFNRNTNNLTCSATKGGDVLSWTEVRTGIHGKIEIRNTSLCMDVNECLETQACPSDHVCHDVWGSHECYQVDEACAQRPCQNGAKCESLPLPGDFICHCPYGYIGKKCETEVNLCDSNPCHSGATCESKHGRYQCLCPEGYTGEKCDSQVDSCGGGCANGGTCAIGGNTTLCTCPSGFSGDRCEVALDACSGLLCANGGSCDFNSTEGNAQCVCAKGWKGDHCQVRYLPNCDASPCLNNGTCIPDDKESARYRCQCPPQNNTPWTYGPNCELLTPCDSNPCLHQATCVNLATPDFLCLCPRDYSGPRCETYIPDLWTTTTVVDYCFGSPCQHYGTCVSMADHFICKCTMKYEGPHCDKLRQKELRVYKGTLTLSEQRYTPELQYDENFHKLFRAQMLRVYWNLTTDSIMRVTIEAIRSGSVIVDFRLDHDIFSDSPVAALDEGDMKTPLLNQLKGGHLGIFKASVANFKFERYYEEGANTAMVGLYAAIVLLTLVLITVVVVIVVVFRRRRYFAPRKLNNKRDELLLTRINNPTFDATHTSNHSPVLNHRSCAEDNVYAEPGDLLPYYATSDCTDDSSSLGSRYPSKRGRDVNIDWAQRRGKEAEEYLEPARDKNCFDASREKEYLEPVKDQDYLEPFKDKEYLDPVKDNKDNLDKEYLEPIKAPPNGTVYAIKRGDEMQNSGQDDYYFTPLPDEPEVKSNNVESANNTVGGAASDYKVPQNNNAIKAEEYMEPVRVVQGASGYVNGPQEYLDMSNGSKRTDHYRSRALPPIPKQ